MSSPVVFEQGRTARRFDLAAVGVLSLLLFVGCSRPAAGPAAATPAAAGAKEAQSAPAEGDAKEASEKQVKISADDAAHMGIGLTKVNAAQYAPETEGYGVIVSHEAIAQAVADAGTAEAASKQSHAALARIERLAGTAGADTVEAHEAAQRQAAADQIAIALAQRKLSSLLGQRPPWEGGDETLLQDLASGHVKVARVTFPLGSLKGAVPHNLRLARLDAQAINEQWRTHTVWNAPADTTMPGRSYFAIVRDANVDEGERLNAWAPNGEADTQSGVWVPAAAAVADSGRYWCYVQREEGTFERTPLDISRPLRDGYFVKRSQGRRLRGIEWRGSAAGSGIESRHRSGLAPCIASFPSASVTSAPSRPFRCWPWCWDAGVQRARRWTCFRNSCPRRSTFRPKRPASRRNRSRNSSPSASRVRSMAPPVWPRCAPSPFRAFRSSPIPFNDKIDVHIARQGISERLSELGSTLPAGVGVTAAVAAGLEHHGPAQDRLAVRQGRSLYPARRGRLDSEARVCSPCLGLRM